MLRGETHYTAPDGTPALKDAVVEKFRRENGLSFKRENISCANGAKQIICNALLATLEPGERSFVQRPTGPPIRTWRCFSAACPGPSNSGRPTASS